MEAAPRFATSLLQLPNHAFKGLNIVNHGTIYYNSSYYSSIDLLINVINSVIAIPLTKWLKLVQKTRAN